jgi:hypothetical protein
MESNYITSQWRRISQGEIRNWAAAESEGGQKFLPPNPLPFCPPERSVLRAERAISSVQNRFGFGHINSPRLNFQIFCQWILPHEARKGKETLASRAQRGSPSGGSKSLAILNICFAQKYE